MDYQKFEIFHGVKCDVLFEISHFENQHLSFFFVKIISCLVVVVVVEYE